VGPLLADDVERKLPGQESTFTGKPMTRRGLAEAVGAGIVDKVRPDLQSQLARAIRAK
jgi:hypothetical protein